MILSRFEQKNFFRFFEIFLCPGPDTLDFGSLWKPHRTFNRYILLVGVSLPIDQQLCQRICSLHYWFGCSHAPNLLYLTKNTIFCEIFLSPSPVKKNIKFFFQKKSGSLYVLHDFESIWAKKIFRFFEIFLSPGKPKISPDRTRKHSVFRHETGSSR